MKDDPNTPNINNSEFIKLINRIIYTTIYPMMAEDIRYLNQFYKDKRDIELYHQNHKND